MTDTMEPPTRFCFVIDGVEPFYDKAKFDDLIVAAVSLIEPDDHRATRVILSERFGDAWSGEKLKRPLWRLANEGRLTRVSEDSRRYRVAR